jgi:hypothetical protein
MRCLNSAARCFVESAASRLLTARRKLSTLLFSIVVAVVAVLLLLSLLMSVPSVAAPSVAVAVVARSLVVVMVVSSRLLNNARTWASLPSRDVLQNYGKNLFLHYYKPCTQEQFPSAQSEG